MNKTIKILDLAKNNKGIITTRKVVEEGFSRGNLLYLHEKGLIEKSSRGVYILSDTFDDEFFNLQVRFNRGIFCLNTALYFFDLTDQTPLTFEMFFPANYNLTNPKKSGIFCRGLNNELYNLGIVDATTPNGNKVKCYSVEKTLCDILCPKNYCDIQIIVNAFKNYVKREDKNIPLLYEYSRIMKVEEKVRSYLEVLL